MNRCFLGLGTRRCEETGSAPASDDEDMPDRAAVPRSSDDEVLDGLETPTAGGMAPTAEHPPSQVADDNEQLPWGATISSFLFFRSFEVSTVSLTPALEDVRYSDMEVLLNDEYEDSDDYDPMDVDRELEEEEEEKAEEEAETEKPPTEEPEDPVILDAESSEMYEEPKKVPPKTKRLDFEQNPMRRRLHSIVADVLYHYRYNKSSAIKLLQTLITEDLGPSALTADASEFIFRLRSDIDAYVKQTIPLSKTCAEFPSFCSVFFFFLGGGGG